MAKCFKEIDLPERAVKAAVKVIEFKETHTEASLFLAHLFLDNGCTRHALTYF
jgi:hypothetical protein